ncbi:MAG: hypothetical protein CSA95_04565 [Bacteroidetes bacterium]|nr:MAG: hypothetical protein CSA95_04565 [Bacteroidota bacterium]
MFCPNSNITQTKVLFTYVSFVYEVSVSSRGCIESPNSRLVKAEKGAFIEVNNPFSDKHHKEVGLSIQTLH